MRDENGLKYHTCPDCEEKRAEYKDEYPTHKDINVDCDLCGGCGDLYATIEMEILDAVDAAPFMSHRYTIAYEKLEDAAGEVRSKSKAERIVRQLTYKRNCLACGSPTTGSVGAAGVRWSALCQKCKDAADKELLDRVKAFAGIL